ncbi:OCIA domain-containing protein 1-like [Trichoplusia ni]|uniref:OCIA domain-containing protein 1-like n=1 Tax=Trichoplusia ni TaxID=7111 RepID=A0A7E5WNH0_TRINI|nr:OCIA domain-containing protein 1-like [Trichoplusia ni]
MTDPTSYGYQESATTLAPPQQAPGTIPSEYRFSPEELIVLGECNRESFIQRSMPLGTAFGVATYLAVQKGHLRPNPRFGPFPKVTLAVMVGYFIGKLSYQQACADKLMALPGSYIGQLLRERRDGKVGGTSMPQKHGPTMFGASPNDIYSDAGPGNSLDLDTDRPIFNDDTYRPDSKGPQSELAPQRPVISYDDLRRKNRGDHADTKQDPYRTVDVAAARPRAVPAPSPHTNQYGDVVE